jgi:hypothetical protein
VEVYPDTHKGHKAHQLPYLFPYLPLLAPPLLITQVSISSQTIIILTTPKDFSI